MSGDRDCVLSTQTASWGSTDIPYSVRYSPRRRHLAIAVHPDLRVIVSAPIGCTEEEVADSVRARAAWIARHLQRFERLPPPPVPRRYVAGETHLYLGEEYPLAIAKGPPHVALSGGRLIVSRPRTLSPRAVEAAIRAWYLERAYAALVPRLEEIHARTQAFSKIPARVRIRWMRRRWGSCSPTGRITLNAELMKLPPACIDYVLTHELCHLLVPNHSPRFYRLLETCMPDWKLHRRQLNEIRM